MSEWFNRKEKGIQTSTDQKKNTPSGLWYKTPTGKIVGTQELKENNYVSPEDDFHVRIDSRHYFEILFDNNTYKLLDPNLEPKDPLNFEDTKKYSERLKAVQSSTGLKDALQSAVGKSKGKKLVICCMDFAFIGGSMGSVVGEKIVRAISYAIRYKLPLMIISQSGGARMMESTLSLMQMVKTSVKLTQLADAKLPFISLCIDPTMGGVTASFAMLGDINIAEPQALIGFAGKRIVQQYENKELPQGFQSAEYLLEHGFLDFIVHRKKLKDKVNLYIDLIQNQRIRK